MPQPCRIRRKFGKAAVGGDLGWRAPGRLRFRASPHIPVRLREAAADIPVSVLQRNLVCSSCHLHVFVAPRSPCSASSGDLRQNLPGSARCSLTVAAVSFGGADSQRDAVVLHTRKGPCGAREASVMCLRGQKQPIIVSRRPSTLACFCIYHLLC